MKYKIIEINPQLSNLILESFPSKARACQILSSREAIRQLIGKPSTQNFPDNFLELKKIEIINNQYLKENIDFLVSISHTKNIGAALIASREQFISIGIDIELSNRVVKHETSKFFVNKYDENQVFSNLLTLWVQKEAAYKAIAPVSLQLINKESLSLKDIWIKNATFGYINSNSPIGTVKVKTEYANEKKLILALASISK